MEPITWPPNVIRFAKAISVAEGSLKAHPDWNNPGDMTESLGFPNRGAMNVDGVIGFQNLDDGWHVLYHQCWLMLSGKSKVYKLDDSLELTGQLYAHGDEAWAINVATDLDVSVLTTLGQIAELPSFTSF